MGFMYLSKEKKFDVLLKRKQMSLDDHGNISHMKHIINLIKTALVKTPIIQDKDFS